MSDTTFRKAVRAGFTGPAQSLQATSALTADDVMDAVEQGFGPPIFSEQVADTAASTDRVARVFYAAIKCRVLTLALVMDADVTANANGKTFDVKKFADGGAISSALATQMVTTGSDGFTARTKRAFTLTGGYIDLAAGDILVIDIGHGANGVQLPKFVVIGTTQIL